MECFWNSGSLFRNTHGMLHERLERCGMYLERRGTVEWYLELFGTVGVLTSALKMTIRQIERDGYSNEKGPTIYISPKSFSTVVSDFARSFEVPSNIGRLSCQNIPNIVTGPCLPDYSDTFFFCSDLRQALI